MSELGDRPEAQQPKGESLVHNERRIAQAQDVKPETDVPHFRDSPEQEIWRYYDSDLHGHVYTHLERPNALEPEAVAVVHGNDSSVREVGRLRYALDKQDCMLRGYTHPPENYGVESALQSEVSEQARAKEIHNMQVWVPDGESAKGWASHGFLEGTRNPGAQGVHWNRRL